ncbi:FeoB-associated Cys-rich membrane protein [Vibrio sp. VB16]|uniref:FeoB-associated Cys-rich membrane protein n=1 Tax=Vibrio sp. VB16 TaxID=2785746 RepID=UPI00189E8794|nr:FeoB-associated Cys-rich membrane protein [Vibrio sp. VB16]UGA56920.1 FeoB-associated Cys-rich membrane protein [Vibrio sp. VB16]
MANIIVALTIILIIALSIFKIVIEKRKGIKCIGCSLSGGCSSNKTQPNKTVGKRINIKEVK